MGFSSSILLLFIVTNVAVFGVAFFEYNVLWCSSSALGDSIYYRPTSCSTEYFSLPPGKENRRLFPPLLEYNVFFSMRKIVERKGLVGMYVGLQWNWNL